MSKQEQRPLTRGDRHSRSLSDSQKNERSPVVDASEDLTIELLEERLTPGYPARFFKKTAGWGC